MEDWVILILHFNTKLEIAKKFSWPILPFFYFTAKNIFIFALKNFLAKEIKNENFLGAKKIFLNPKNIFVFISQYEIFLAPKNLFSVNKYLLILLLHYNFLFCHHVQIHQN